MKEFITIQET